jgi:hypothetical protein
MLLLHPFFSAPEEGASVELIELRVGSGGMSAGAWRTTSFAV